MKRLLTATTDTNVIKTTKQVERTPFVLWALILFMFVAIGRIQELFSGFGKLYLGKVFGILMLGAYFLYSGEKNRITLRKFPELICILGILFFGFLSIPFGVWPGNSVDFMLGFLVKDLAFFYIVARTLTTMNQLRKLVFALLVAVTILSVSALTGRDELARISAGVTYDPNDLALLLICALPFAAFGFFEEKGVKKILLLLGVGLIIITVILTHSRGGFIGLLVGGGIILFKAFKKRELMAGLLLTGAIVMFMFLTPQGYWERMSTIVEPGDDYNITSPAGRIEVWKRGLQFVIENPITGVGIGNFTTAEGLSHKDVGGKWSTAHNSFIQIGGELGVGGLILFILLFYYLFKSLRRIISKDPKIKTLKDSLEVSLIGYVIGGFFLSQAYSMVLYLIIGMTVALNYVVKRSDLNHV